MKYRFAAIARMPTVPAVIMLLAVVIGTGSAQTGVLDNDLTGTIGIHDPVMTKEGNTYHVYGTHDAHLVSTDRKSWNPGPRMFTSQTLPSWIKTAVPANTGDLWAPDVHYRNGRFHIYYSASSWGSTTSAIGFATNVTLDPASAGFRWNDQGLVVASVQGQDNADKNSTNSIDPNIFVDTNNIPWLIFGSFCCEPLAGIRLVRLDSVTGKPTINPPKLTSISSVGEGPCLFKRGIYYYLLVSIGVCCAGMNSTYHVVMGRSRALSGPYLDKTGKDMNQGGYSLLLKGNSRYPGLGGNGLFVEHDTTFMVFHAYDSVRNGASVLFIKPLFLDAQGWLTMDPKLAVSVLSNGHKPAQRGGIKGDKVFKIRSIVKDENELLISLPSSRVADFSIYGADGRLAVKQLNAGSANGRYRIVLESGKVRSGIYLVKIICGQDVYTGKFLLR
jgi:arabinan endo-1,5-alpha-L-arabinosidase